ncbi:MAG: GNAT family N-acetyltransferase [Coriobacteriales bacterium]|jgi:GNAT superfamily N-acetyltransferase|nr:GNAT family N-acetyltransferase [Coriobacteriales bacterium]
MIFEAIRATAALADAWGQINSVSWQKGYEGIIPADYLDAYTPEKRAQAFREKLLTDLKARFLFKVDGCLAGLAILDKACDEDTAETDGELLAFYFLPEYWGTPATHTAFEFCMNWLKEQGFSRAKIWTFEKNLRARKFYEKYGFFLDGAEELVDLGWNLPLSGLRYSKVFLEE